MKKLLLIFTVLLLKSSIVSTQDYWEILNTPITDENIHAIEVDSNGNIFIGLSPGEINNGGVYRSDDNGATWEFLGVENKYIHSIEINELGNIYVGAGMDLFRSFDNGETWEIVWEGLSTIIAIESYPGGLLFATSGTGNTESVVRSTDYGNTWEEVLIVPSNTEYAYDYIIKSIDSIYIAVICWLGGSLGGVYQSIDGGDSWINIGLTDHYVSSLAMNSSGDLFAGTRGHYSQYEGGVYILPNGQTDWINLNNEELVTSMVINSEDDIYIGCSTLDWVWGGVRLSMDNGQTWEDMSSETMYDRDIESLVLGPAEHLYALEHNSPTPLYVSVDPTITLTKEKHYEVNFITYSSPNPFRESTQIWYKLENVSNVELNVFNYSGQLINTTNEGVKTEGIHYIEFIATGLKNGIYFYTISINGHIADLKKLIIMK